MRNVTALVAGLVFGLGLLISDMANPARVLAFLDVLTIATGEWDPTLAFVMAGAMAVSGLAWAMSLRRTEAAWGGPLPSAPSTRIDARLIGGAALFGAGWGLAGICPGPALTAAGIGGTPMLIFLAAMAVGMAAFGALERRTAAPARG